MTVPMAAHQILIQGQQNDANLQTGCRRNQGDGLSGLDMSGLEFFDQGYGVVVDAVFPYRSTVITASWRGLSPNDADTRVIPFAYRTRRCLVRVHLTRQDVADPELPAAA